MTTVPHNEERFFFAEEMFDKAEFAIRESRYNDARSFLKEAIDSNPHFTFAYILLSRILHKTGDTITAVKTLERCLSIDRGFGYTYYLLAKYSQISGDRNSARDYLKKGLQLDPRNALLNRIMKWY
jgi:tetratricopeptide (TPR) repeat protein